MANQPFFAKEKNAYDKRYMGIVQERLKALPMQL
jgi:hypothetical protein